MFKKSYLYDLLILSGLVSLGTGLFFVYGTGKTMISMGVIVFVMGAFGHYKGDK
jgi:hypothetical protein